MRYLRDPKYAALPRLQLARILRRDQPDVFGSVEHARSLLRYYAGQHGQDNRDRVTPGASGGAFIEESRVTRNPWAGLPPALREFEWKPVPLEEKLTAVISDIHLPYYDPEALLPTLRDLETRNPDCICVLGDLLDFYEISKFSHDPSQDHLRETLVAGLKFWQSLRRRFPKARLVWKFGNHEERWEHYCWRKAPEFCTGIPQFKELDWIMNHPSLFSEYPDADANLDVEVVKTPVPLTIGALFLMHGHEYGRGNYSPVNAARTAQLKLMECAIIGHQHQRSEQSVTTIAGRTVSSWSVGCLCNLHPRYSPFNPAWSHSFLYVERLHGQNFLVTPRRVIQGEVF